MKDIRADGAHIGYVTKQGDGEGMSDRLAEIEAYCGIEGPWVRVIDGCTFTFDDPPLDIINQRWLIARIRELEAQAERDAKVVEAAVAYREAERKVAEAGYAPMSIGDRLIRGDIREALDAALAAREVREGMMTRLDRIEKRWERNQLMHDDCALLIAVGKAAAEVFGHKNWELFYDHILAGDDDDWYAPVLNKIYALEALVTPLLEEVRE